MPRTVASSIEATIGDARADAELVLAVAVAPADQLTFDEESLIVTLGGRPAEVQELSDHGTRLHRANLTRGGELHVRYEAR